MKLPTFLCLCLMNLIFPVLTMAGALPATPFIRINTEMHSAKIMDIAADARGSVLATASYDKSVKIWEADTGKLLKTLRPPIGEGVEGTLNAVALSPDGAIAATAGRTGITWDKSFCIYLFDVGTGEMTRRIGGFAHPVQRLLFSPDGKRLAVGFSNSGGLTIVNLDNGKMIADEMNFKGNCFGIDFDAEGNLIAASDEGVIRRYRPDGTVAYSLQSDNGKQIYSIRFSPDGTLFAVGYDDRNSVEIRTAADGTVAFDLQEPKGHVSSVAWSVDGQYIMAAGNKQGQDARKLLIKWSARRKYLDEVIVLPSKNTITQLIPLKNGSVAFVSRQSGFGAIGVDDRRSRTEVSGKRGGKKEYNYSEIIYSKGGHSFFNRIAAADFQKNHDSFKISSDASTVLFSYERHGQAKAQFDLKTRRIMTGDLPESALLPPRFTGNSVDVRNWENSSQPRLNKKPLKDFGHREKSWSLSVRHDENGFVLGTNHYLRSYSNKGELLWKRRVPQVAWDVAISADDHILVATLDDSTIRWYHLDDGKELYSLYLHPDRKQWILWSPEGYFDHSPGSENLVGFLVNRSADTSSIMVGLDQMYDVFYRPDLIDMVIAGKDISAYLQHLTKRVKTAGVEKQGAYVAADEKVLEKSAQERLAALKVEGDRKAIEQAAKGAAEQKEREKKAAEKLVKELAEKEQLRLEQIRAEKPSPAIVEQSLPNDDVRPSDEVIGVDDPTISAQNIALAVLVNTKTLPPKVRFISTSGSSEARDFTLKAELCDNGGGIGNVTLFINNTPIAFERGDRGLIVRDKSASQACQNFERIITLASGQNVISLMAFNGDNNIESNRDQVTLNYVTTDAEKPQLHILTIAVNSYRDGDLRLKYSLNDAEGVISLATEKGKSLFAGIDVYRLHDAEVTKAKMEAVFAQIGAKTKRGDVFLLFMAGHGLTDETDGMYYFLPVDFRYTGQESIAKQGISMNDFKRFLTSIQAMKTLLMIDTCNSGSFSEGIATRGVTDKTAINKLTRAIGRATIVASSKNQVALEGYEGHGVFSYTLLDGMKGKAANKKGEITINHLATFIEETLPELTFKKWGYEQIPQKTLIGSDFSIGVK